MTIFSDKKSLILTSVLSYKQNMFLSNNKFRLAAVTKDNTKECAKLLAYQYVQANEAWSTVRPSKEKAEKFMVDKIEELLAWEQELRDQGFISRDAFLNFVYLNEHDEIIGVATACQLTQFLNRKSEALLSEFQMLEKYGEELEKNIFKKDIVPGRNIYGVFTTIKHSYQGSGITMLFWFDLSHYLHTIGFRFMYCRVTSEKGCANFVNNGGEMIAKTTGIQNEKKLQFYWIRWSLRPLSVVNHLTEKVKERARL